MLPIKLTSAQRIKYGVIGLALMLAAVFVVNSPYGLHAAIAVVFLGAAIWIVMRIYKEHS